MKQTLITIALLASLNLVSAQEKVSREEALSYAKAASADAKQLNATPITTDVDAQQPVAVKEGEYGGMVLPQKNLKAEAISKATEALLPVGQLWLHNLTPMKGDDAIAESKLRVVTVNVEGTELSVPQCALAVRRTTAGTLELVVFGKGKEPIVTAPLKAIDAKQETPIDLAAKRDYDSGEVTIKILGKYQASIKVTELLL
jgi:uncharacterized protein YyaL (SSP411 family)